ncbi:MAG: DUF3808 domain-containing protein [Ignavibacterium sp.]|nr:DUF3808 domain-containing protein [Ignavibacterium sp.]
MKIILFALFIFINFSFSQQISERSIQKGLDALYNFEWEKSDKIFNKFIEDYPEEPVGYHYSSIKPLWFYLGSFNKAYLDTFFTASDKALNLAKNIEKEDSLTANLAFLLSSIYSNRSIANARDENYLFAVWENDRMKYYADEALLLNEKLYDAHIGPGLYNLAVSQIPSSLQWAIKIVGIDGDREIGIEHLETVIKKGILSRVDAKFYLSQIYSRIIIDYSHAEKLLRDLTNKYPRNLLFRMSLAWVELEEGNILSAERKFQSIVNNKQPEFPILKSLSNYQLGNINFYKGKLDTAISFYEKYLQTKLRNDYEGITNLNVGIALELSGLRDSALIFYEETAKGNPDLDEDSFAKRKGQILLEDSLSFEQRRFFFLKNLFKEGKYKILIDSLKSFISDSLSNDLKAEAYLLLNQAYLKQKKYTEVIVHSAKTLDIEIKNENWIRPYALYYGALASYHLKNFTDSQLFLNLISDYSDYDFSLKLEGLKYALKRKLDKLKLTNSK